ncbi:ABC transporter ATP-binding protein/permease, partial [Allofournierella sp.]
QEMHKEAEHFRRVTMKVLSMQLNSIIVMDLIAYGGAALGIVIAAGEFGAGRIGFLGCFAIVLLSAEFFLPLRALGSFFHVAMNGMAASDKIFRLLDLPERAQSRQEARGGEIALCGVRFAYEPEREILRGVDMTFAPGSFTAIVGESGCGKSTVAALLTGRNAGYGGSVTLGGAELAGLNEASLMRTVTLVSHNSYLFKGTVRESLQMGDDRAGDEALWRVLERVRLADFLRAEKGLDTPLTENAGNLSGGQRQRLALARALLHDSPVYIFDEATSNIDVESENDIMELIHSLAKSKTVILISHRLANAAPADKIYVMKAGRVVQQGTHAALLAEGGLYETLWENQQALEQYAYTKEAAV